MDKCKAVMSVKFAKDLIHGDSIVLEHHGSTVDSDDNVIGFVGAIRPAWGDQVNVLIHVNNGESKGYKGWVFMPKYRELSVRPLGKNNTRDSVNFKGLL